MPKQVKKSASAGDTGDEDDWGAEWPAESEGKRSKSKKTKWVEKRGLRAPFPGTWEALGESWGCWVQASVNATHVQVGVGP